MKRLLIAAALLLASLLPAAAQGAQPWTIHGIAEHWSYEEVPVPEIKGKEVQIAGKKRMDIKAFLIGFREPEEYSVTPGTSKAEIAKTKVQ